MVSGYRREEEASQAFIALLEKARKTTAANRKTLGDKNGQCQQKIVGDYRKMCWIQQKYFGASRKIVCANRKTVGSNRKTWVLTDKLLVLTEKLVVLTKKTAGGNRKTVGAYRKNLGAKNGQC